MTGAITFSVIILNVLVLCNYAKRVILLSIILLSVLFLSVIFLSVIFLSVIFLIAMISVIMLKVLNACVNYTKRVGC
jgi:hypothetical protein